MKKVIGFMGIAALVLAGCGDSSSTEADRIGVGGECSQAAECESADEDITLTCLTQFTGGYCGLEGCEGDGDCPEGSACIDYEDGNNYCFRVCVEKPECNENRSLENESNCSANVVFVDERNERKACVPPSSGL
jgi:hypothetical protein